MDPIHVQLWVNVRKLERGTYVPVEQMSRKEYSGIREGTTVWGEYLVV